MSKNYPFPLYHGTSSIFLSSILETGLGGKNIIKELKVQDLAKEMFPFVIENFGKNKPFFKTTCEIESFKRMAQNIESDIFQYGDIYVTACLSHAYGYATSSPWGSELLSYVFLFFDRLMAINVKECETWKKKYPEIFNFKNTKGTPLILSLSGVKFSDLLTERGDEISEDEINETFKSKTAGGLSEDIRKQLGRFRLKHTVDKSNLKIYIPVTVNSHPNDRFDLIELDPSSLSFKYLP